MAKDILENTEGLCYRCDFYDKDNDYCRRAEKAFGSMVSPICLAKMQVILLQDLVQLFEEYLYEDEEE